MEKKNYVQIRIESKNNKKFYQSVQHNTRTKMTQKDKNKNIMNNNDNYIKIFDNQENNYYTINYKNENTKIFNRIKEMKEEHIKKHTELNLEYQKIKYKDNPRNIRNLRQNRVSSTLEGVITFSELVKDIDFSNQDNIKKFFELSKNSIDEVLKEMNNNIELLYITLHLDEKSPHIHFEFTNYDQNGHSVFKKNRNSEKLSKLQDIVGNHFQELGFQRGIKKEITGAIHTKTYDWKKAEIKKFQEEKKDLEFSNNILEHNINQEQNRRRKEFENTLKNEYKQEIDKNIELKNKNIKVEQEIEEKIKNTDNIVKNQLEQEKDVVIKQLELLRKEVIKIEIDVEDKKKIYSEIAKYKDMLKNSKGLDNDTIKKIIDNSKKFTIIQTDLLANNFNEEFKKIQVATKEIVKENQKLIKEKDDIKDENIALNKSLQYISNFLSEEQKEIILDTTNKEQEMTLIEKLTKKIDLVDFITNNQQLGEIQYSKSSSDIIHIKTNNKDRVLIWKNEESDDYLYYSMADNESGNIINFYRNYINNKISFKETLLELGKIYKKDYENKEISLLDDNIKLVKTRKSYKEIKEEKELKQLENITPIDLKNISTYRNIDIETLKEFNIYKDNRNNIHFNSYSINQENKLYKVGSEIRNVKTKFKAFEGTKALTLRKIGQEDTIYIFESMFDAMSYREIYKKDGIYLSISGQYSKIQLDELLKYIKTRNIEKVNLCLDNDVAGIKMTKELNEILLNNNIKIVIDKPISKDFNEDLKNNKINENFNKALETINNIKIDNNKPDFIVNKIDNNIKNNIKDDNKLIEKDNTDNNNFRFYR